MGYRQSYQKQSLLELWKLWKVRGCNFDTDTVFLIMIT